MSWFMKKILVAEDDRNLSKSIDTWLTLEGFEVVTVYNGGEALNKLLHQKYDLLITDIAMPHLNGLELINEIRRINPTLPIMVVSGKLNQELVEDLQQLGVNYILSKPIKPIEFRKMIETVFDGTLH
ncbi:MAG: response regulator [Calditrichaeota bacterium]|nr:MAG: response regulator [Calditrichota bacterium]